MNQADKYKSIDEYIDIVKRTSLIIDDQIDENITFPSAALLAHSFSVIDACGGHLGKKNGGPFIDMVFHRYDDFVHVYRQVEGEKKDKQRLLIKRQISLFELELIKLLNSFYASRSTKYEIMLAVTQREDFVLRLQTHANSVIDELADQEKRKEWLIAANQELFDFGAFLFDLKFK